MKKLIGDCLILWFVSLCLLLSLQAKPISKDVLDQEIAAESLVGWYTFHYTQDGPSCYDVRLSIIDSRLCSEWIGGDKLQYVGYWEKKKDGWKEELVIVHSRTSQIYGWQWARDGDKMIGTAKWELRKKK